MIGTKGPGEVSGTPLALAVCGQLPEVLVELIWGQLTLTMAGEHRFHAQIRPQDDSAIRTAILDHIVARQVPTERHMSWLHSSKVWHASPIDPSHQPQRPFGPTDAVVEPRF